MKQHKTPCYDCPWRRKSLAGWVGGTTPEDWIAAAHGESIIECHTSKHSEQCAGAAIYRANVHKVPKHPNPLILPNNEADVFSSPIEFLQHHNRLGHTSADPYSKSRRKRKA